MMKQWLVFLLVCMAVLPVIGHTEATEITKECQLVFAPRSEGKKNMSDASYITFYKGKYLEVVTPEDAPC